MKSKLEMPKEYQIKFEEYLKHTNVTNKIYPNKFNEIMKTHRGLMNFFEKDNPDYIELRNPLIVVLGDSVTAGHFEVIDMEKFLFAQDLQDCYVEKFKEMLHEKYQMTSLNIINSGVAGDNAFGMYKRLNQDVLQYKPDVVILNGSLNWSTKWGDNEAFKKYYRLITEAILNSGAELILMTSNMCTNDETHYDRILYIRELAEEKKVPLVDVYKMYENVVEDKEDLEDILVNKMNHPSPLGHTYMAKALMQLFED